jgi:hypothetical protein
MAAPTAYLRKLREQRDSRRLGVARCLRETPNATDIELAKIFDVSRNTIALDRKYLMAQVVKESITTVGEYRQQQLARLSARRQELVDLRKRLMDHLIDPKEAVDLALKILAREKDDDEFEAKLTGTPAPSTSIVGHQDLNYGIQYEFLEHKGSLDDDWVRANIFPLMDQARTQLPAIEPDFSGFHEQLEAKNETES